MGSHIFKFAMGHQRRWLQQLDYNANEFYGYFWDLFDGDMASKLVCFAIDGVIILGYENKGDSATHRKACTICH
jgi:hypothetical protein